MSKVKIVLCPTCQQQVVWEPASKSRPFCSERCKMVDLHGWFTEKHTIPGEALEGDSPASSLTDDSSTESS